MGAPLHLHRAQAADVGARHRDREPRTVAREQPDGGERTSADEHPDPQRVTVQRAIGVEAVVGVHHQILGAIPPDEMARSIALMLPAMNVEDRTEMLGGMRAEAPPEVFEGVWSLAGSVLAPADRNALATRLELA